MCESRCVRYIVATTIWAAALSPVPADGADTRTIVESLPRAWCGQYRWRGDPLIQQFALAFSTVSIRHKDATVVAGGRATIIVPGNRYTVLITATIDPRTRTIELREHRPEPDTPDFTTDGGHRGSLGRNWRSIRAVWTQNSTGEQGDLTLRAVQSSATQPPSCHLPSV